MTRIDHFMYAVPSLDEGTLWAKETFGVEPAYGGEHLGLGTRNALLSLGDTYLEIIAPDPAQPLEGNLGATLAGLERGGMVTWALEGDLGRVAKTLEERSVAARGPVRTQRQTQTGDLLVWDLLFPSGSKHGARMPFFIDWLECPNPKDTNPAGGALRSVEISTPEAADLQELLAVLGLEQSISEGEPALQATIETARGVVVLRSTPETSRMTL